MTIALGLMSGTSMDGVDAVACDIKLRAGQPRLKILARAKTPYPPRVRRTLSALSAACGGTVDDLLLLNVRVGEVFARAALKVMARPELAGARVSLIGAHGQTVRHAPEKGATLQVGDAALIAARTGVRTWSDFRSADVARGGQGAPLAPIVHLPLFGDRRLDVVVVNIGGIANVTHIPAGARGLSDLRAWDTGPGNILMDMAARRVGAGPYDRNGRLASAGRVDQKLLRGTLSHPYFRRRPPKSTGREAFGEPFWRRAGLDGWSGSAADLLATLAELTAMSVMDDARGLLRRAGSPGRIVLCGGGAKNGHLVRRMRALAPPGVDVAPSGALGAPPLAVEGALMALLAVYADGGVRLDLSTITGAKGGAILGRMAPA